MRYRKTPAALYVLAIAVVVAATAASGASGHAGPSVSGAAGAKPVRIAVLVNSTANTYVAADVSGAKAAAKKFGGTVVKVYDGNFSASTQASQITDAVTSKQFDAFVILAEAGNVIVPEIKSAIASGIKVVCLLSPCGANPLSTARQIPGYVTTVGYLFSENGVDIAKAVVLACAKLNPCNVVYEPGSLSLAAEKNRTVAFNAYLKKFTNIKVLAEQVGNYDANTGRTTMQNMLEAHPDINVAASSGDQMTLGMQQAVKSAGLTGKVLLIGNGAATTGVKAVRLGQWFATVANLPYTEGYLGAEYAIKAATGTPLSKIPAFIDDLKYSPVGTTIITKANVGKFKAQWVG